MVAMVTNKGFIFKKPPGMVGSPVPGEHLTVEARDIDLESVLPPGGLILKNLYHSLDPYQRKAMRAATTPDYIPAYKLGVPITGFGLSKVFKSTNDNFKQGDIVLGVFPCEEYTTLSTADQIAETNVAKLENPHRITDLKNFLGSLGMPGITAYGSLFDIGQPKKGETIFISAASGAVGQVVGQLAKLEGLKVIGSVGSDEKLRYIVDDLGFDAGFNYKKEPPKEALPRLAPQGVDIYYENVGGEHLEAALQSMNHFGRIVVCGMISQYQDTPYGIKNLLQMVARRLTMRGFMVSDHYMGPQSHWHIEHQDRVGKWIKEGTLKVFLQYVPMLLAFPNQRRSFDPRAEAHSQPTKLGISNRRCSETLGIDKGPAAFVDMSVISSPNFQSHTISPNP